MTVKGPVPPVMATCKLVGVPEHTVAVPERTAVVGLGLTVIVAIPLVTDPHGPFCTNAWYRYVVKSPPTIGTGGEIVLDVPNEPSVANGAPFTDFCQAVMDPLIPASGMEILVMADPSQIVCDAGPIVPATLE